MAKNKKTASKKATNNKARKKNGDLTRKEELRLIKEKGIPFWEEDEKTGSTYNVYPDGTKIRATKGNKGVKYVNVDFDAYYKGKPSFKPSKVRRMQGHKPNKGMMKYARKGFVLDEWSMAREVAGQPAGTKKEKLNKNEARREMQYLEAKFPKTYTKNDYYDKKKSNKKSSAKGKKKKK